MNSAPVLQNEAEEGLYKEVGKMIGEPTKVGASHAYSFLRKIANENASSNKIEGVVNKKSVSHAAPSR